MAPIYEEVHDYFSDPISQGYDGNLVISRMSGRDNSLFTRGLGVQGFPTILLFFPNESEQKVIYSGKADFDEITEWINEKIRIGPDVSDVPQMKTVKPDLFDSLIEYIGLDLATYLLYASFIITGITFTYQIYKHLFKNK